MRAACHDVHTQLAREGRLCDVRCAKWAAHASLRTDPISRVRDAAPEERGWGISVRGGGRVMQARVSAR